MVVEVEMEMASGGGAPNRNAGIGESHRLSAVRLCRESRILLSLSLCVCVCVAEDVVRIPQEKRYLNLHLRPMEQREQSIN